ncbi:hypothetical protein [Saccharopolyspora sp. 6V]|uniref:hypothetical protein n=1 Tax=Saccharopolyspora sp. 6V TaxID=2877239 RepID=UPI001CD73EA3|nr:hypothetical protein [Saccharopolyspora sp. 6V]MCA1191677.1 hypothetical protein [Saccharopolyspora sp. 6V]
MSAINLLSQARQHAPKVLPQPIAILIQREMRNGERWINKVGAQYANDHPHAFYPVYGNVALAVLAMSATAETFDSKAGAAS